MSRMILVALIFLLPPAPVVSQISGRVLDESGNPITTASVQLLGPSGVLSSTRSNARGEFDLLPVRGANRVRASQFGFESVSVELGDLSKPLRLVLAPKPFELEEVRAVSAQPSCPTRDNPEARAAWFKALSKVQDLSDEDGWGAYYLEWRRSRGLAAEFGPMAEITYEWALQTGSSRSLSRLWLRDDGIDLVLARKLAPGELPDGQSLAWQIAGVYAAFTPLFLNPGLTLRSVITWSTGGDGVVLCHEDEKGARTRVTAALDGAGIVSDIVWTLKTPDPVETAGGHLTFSPPTDGVLLPLPSTSYFWHRGAWGRNSQDFRTFSPWVVGENVVPRLVEYRDSVESVIGNR